MRSLGVICDMKRRRRRLGGLYSGFFAKKRVSRVIVAIHFGQRGDIRSQVVAFPPHGAEERQVRWPSPFRSKSEAPAFRFDAFSVTANRYRPRIAAGNHAGPETDTGTAHRRENREHRLRRQHVPERGFRIVRNPNSIAAIAPEVLGQHVEPNRQRPLGAPVLPDAEEASGTPCRSATGTTRTSNLATSHSMPKVRDRHPAGRGGEHRIFTIGATREHADRRAGAPDGR